MGTLCSGKGRRLESQAGRSGRPDLDLDALIAQELDAGSSVAPTTPVTPEKWRIPDSQWMQQDADLARLLGGFALPLTLLTQRAGTATADAGRIHHAQAAIGFSTPLMGVKRLPSRTLEGAIGLERKVLPREAPRFPGGGRGGRTIPRRGR